MKMYQEHFSLYLSYLNCAGHGASSNERNYYVTAFGKQSYSRSATEF